MLASIILSHTINIIKKLSVSHHSLTLTNINRNLQHTKQKSHHCWSTGHFNRYCRAITHSLVNLLLTPTGIYWNKGSNFHSASNIIHPRASVHSGQLTNSSCTWILKSSLHRLLTCTSDSWTDTRAQLTSLMLDFVDDLWVPAVFEGHPVNILGLNAH